MPPNRNQKSRENERTFPQVIEVCKHPQYNTETIAIYSKGFLQHLRGEMPQSVVAKVEFAHHALDATSPWII